MARQLSGDDLPLVIYSYWQSMAAGTPSINSLVHEGPGVIWCRVGLSRIGDDDIEGVCHSTHCI